MSVKKQSGGKRENSGRKNKQEYKDKLEIYLKKIDERINERQN